MLRGHLRGGGHVFGVSIVTPERQFYTAAEFLKIVAAAAEVSGASVVESGGVIRMTLKK